MPNWCSNRMYFSGEPAQIAEIKRLASGAVTPFYRRATNEGIQLFLAGSAGLLQTTEDVQFEPCPGLTAAGRGVVSPENIAFTRWLTHLQNGVLLDEQNCLMLHELWLQSGTEQRRWEGLPDDVRDTITALFTAKRGDWCGFWSTGGCLQQTDAIRPERLCVCPDVVAVMANVVRHSEQRHDILCEAEWCTGGALGNFTDTAEILRSGFHCRVSFHDDPAIILDDGQGTRGRIFQCVQPFRFLCYQPDCQCGR